MIILTMKRIVFSCIAALSASVSYASVTLPDIISDNMVLQQKSDARLWGWATPGSKITVTRLTQPSQARMDAGMLR